MHEKWVIVVDGKEKLGTALDVANSTRKSEQILLQWNGVQEATLEAEQRIMMHFGHKLKWFFLDVFTRAKRYCINTYYHPDYFPKMKNICIPPVVLFQEITFSLGVD